MTAQRRRLLLLRHAEAGPYQDTLAGDRARTLTPYGREQALSIGRKLSQHDYARDLAIVASAAIRTRETAEIVRDSLKSPVDVMIDAELYTADITAFYDLIHALPDGSLNVLIVGHNPAIGTLAHELAGPAASAPAFTALQSGYPTATLTIFEAPAQWVDFRPSTVTIEGVITP